MSRRVTRLFLILAIALVGLMRLHLAITRAFDPDEFAHFHWSYLLLTGKLPYRDFFFIIIPAYQIFLLPVFLIGQSAATLIAARLWQFALYVTTALLVYRVSLSLFKKQTGALLSVLLFITFPMTLDKTIDMRPDMLMIAMMLSAMLLVLHPKHWNGARSLLAGLCMGLSLFIHPKIVFAMPMFIYLVATASKKPRIVHIFSGFLAPFLLFFLFLAFHQALPAALTSLTQDSVVANIGKAHFSLFLALSPFPLVYVGKAGVSLPWLVNTALWIASAVGLIVLFIRSRPLGFALFLYFAFGIGLLLVFPVPFLQYFLPLTVFASIIVGYVATEAYSTLTIPLVGNVCLTISIFVLLSSFFLQYRERVAQGADNREQLQVIRDALAVTKPGEPIYDMVGSYVFRPDGFFICCHPYGEFIHRLASRPGLERGLRESLIATKTKFLVMDRVGFVFWQTPEPDLTFLRSNYLPMNYNKLYSLGVQFHCQNGACVQYTMNNQPASNMSTSTFTIIVPETYTMTLEPNNLTATVDGKEVRNGQTLGLSVGAHRFLASPTINSLRIQLAR